VLTSGGNDKAVDSIAILNQLNNLSIQHNNCKILVGSGIDANNIKQIVTNTNIKQIHIGNGVRDSQGNLCKDKLLAIKMLLPSLINSNSVKRHLVYT
jgi:copper homeostasis protein